jgi:hypothetical protein
VPQNLPRWRVARITMPPRISDATDIAVRDPEKPDIFGASSRVRDRAVASACDASSRKQARIAQNARSILAVAHLLLENSHRYARRRYRSGQSRNQSLSPLMDIGVYV